MTTPTFSSASSSADAIIGERICSSTKRLYASKIKTIRQFYADHLSLEFTIPVILGQIRAFFGWLLDDKHKDKPLAPSTSRHYKSALVWLYKEEKLIIADDINQELETLLNGYQRRVATFRSEGKMPVFEGKYHLTFDGYRLLARMLMTCDQFNQMLFAWPYLVIQWNLIARAITVADLMMEHVGWQSDSLLITTPKHKGDQEGVKAYARHIYANPLDPVICPVLALAVLTFVRSLRHDPAASSSRSNPASNFPVFDGTNNSSRFSEVLLRTIGLVPDTDVHLLGGEKKQLGTHSVRKGAASYCAGMMNVPSTVQVFLRAGWSLGNVQDRYLFAGQGGDQFTGRVLSGLSFIDSSFATLPPHFTQDGLRLIAWTTILPQYAQLPATFKQALPMLLASICYHEEWLRSTLPAHHPLFATHLFASGSVEQLKPHVLLGCSRCPVTGIVATGIPPHLVMSNGLIDVVKHTQALKEELLSKCAQLPTELTDTLLDKFTINGAIPVTAADLTKMLNTIMTQMRAELRETRAPQPTDPLSSLSTDPNADPRFKLWSWGGKFHMVPEGWVFPSTNVKDTWQLWYFGHLADQIRPLRYLKKADLLGGGQVALWSKTHGVTTAIVAVMVEMKLLEAGEDVVRLSRDQSSTLFDQAIVQLMEKVKTGLVRERGRWMEMSVPTLYAHILRARKRRREEEEQKEDDEQIQQ
jgi:hypothetical protein